MSDRSVRSLYASAARRPVASFQFKITIFVVVTVVIGLAAGSAMPESLFLLR
jgi:hypothetical protein